MRYKVKLALSVSSFVAMTVGHYTSVLNTRLNKVGDKMFRQGDADDVISDSLKSGDLLLMRRRNIYNYDFLSGIVITLNRMIYSLDFDHVGVIVLDNNGKPYVFELSIQGKRLRPYSDRILNSFSDQIVLLPLNCRKLNDTVERESAWSSALSISNDESYDITEFCGMVNSTLRGVLRGCTEEFYKNTPISPSATFVATFLLSIDIDLATLFGLRIEDLSPMDFLHLCSDDTNFKNQVQNKLKNNLYGKMIVIRTY